MLIFQIFARLRRRRPTAAPRHATRPATSPSDGANTAVWMDEQTARTPRSGRLRATGRVNPSITGGEGRAIAATFAFAFLAVAAGTLFHPLGTSRGLALYTAARFHAWPGADDGDSLAHQGSPDFPHDLADVASPAKRKHLFLTSLRPVVDQENQWVAAQRRWLLDTRRRLVRGKATPAEMQALRDLATYYRLPTYLTVPATGGVSPPVIGELLLRVDTLPPSLVMAQAAIESGWGTSRFVREGNNLFGQWVTGDTPGLVPVRADPADGYRVATYDTVSHSVRSYLRNLNTHRAYRQLRRWRADLRAAGEPLDSTILSAGLVRYSQRGEAYVEELLSVIRGNRLDRFDRLPSHLAGTRWEGTLLARQ